MYSQFHLDFRDEDHRPYPGLWHRHRAAEPAPLVTRPPAQPPVAPPSWAEPTRLHPSVRPDLRGEAVTRVLPAPVPPSDALLMPLVSRSPGAALKADSVPPPKLAQLATCLRSLRDRIRP